MAASALAGLRRYLLRLLRQSRDRLLKLVGLQLPPAAPPLLLQHDSYRRSLPVLCFGDSLTEGYHGVWIHPEFSPADRVPFDGSGHEIGHVRFRPYGVRLGAALASDAADGAEGYKAALRYAVTRAYSGFTAEALQPMLGAALRERPWRCACILAGTNDVVLEGADASTVLSRIEALHDACDQAGLPVIAVTLPDADLKHHGMVPPAEAEERRAVLAAVAEGIARSCRRRKRPLADARADLPLGPELYDDCLHPSPAGSDKLAECLYDAIHQHRL